MYEAISQKNGSQNWSKKNLKNEQISSIENSKNKGWHQNQLNQLEKPWKFVERGGLVIYQMGHNEDLSE